MGFLKIFWRKLKDEINYNSWFTCSVHILQLAMREAAVQYTGCEQESEGEIDRRDMPDLYSELMPKISNTALRSVSSLESEQHAG